MNASFPRILTLLRKERGLSQKKAAEDLQVSQAVLSHYEKGIRECGLEFLVRAARYYRVSCDYLLGISADRMGTVISVEDIPEGDPSVQDNRFKGSLLPVLNKKLLINSLNIVFDLLQKYGSKALTTEASAYLNTAVYTIFRQIYSGNPKNQSSMFSIPNYMFLSASSGEMSRMAAAVGEIASGRKVGDADLPDTDMLEPISSETLMKDYPMFTTSLLNLLKNSETRMERE